MHNIILFDGKFRNSLLPLVYTRPIGSLRVGILTIAEKWEKILNQSVSFHTAPHLSGKFKLKSAQQNLFIYGGLLPDSEIIKEILSLDQNSTLLYNDLVIAANIGLDSVADFINQDKEFTEKKAVASVQLIKNLPDIIRLHGSQITADFELLTKNRISSELSGSNRVIGQKDKIFLEPGAKAECAIFNTESGPIYLGKDSEVMEGAMIRGPFGLGDHAAIKMGSKIYPNVSTGPHCKLGGEAGNSVLYAFTNKGHEGYLGDSYIGEWCNLGADTNTSNLKNNYAEVKLWDYQSGRFALTGLQFCGLIMGDHSKAGINTMFNTGTVVGVGCNIFGDGYPRNFIPSFSWGGAAGLTSYSIDKAFEASNAMMTRRGLSLTEEEKNILSYTWEADKQWRK